MRAWDHTQAAGIACYRVQIERDFNISAHPMPAVGMPARIADIVVAVAAHVVEIRAQQARKQPLDMRMVEKRGKPFALIDERNNAGAPGKIVDDSALREHGLELRRDPLYIVRQKRGQLQITKGLEELLLLLCGFQRAVPPVDPRASSWFWKTVRLLRAVISLSRALLLRPAHSR